MKPARKKLRKPKAYPRKEDKNVCLGILLKRVKKDFLVKMAG